MKKLNKIRILQISQVVFLVNYKIKTFLQILVTNKHNNKLIRNKYKLKRLKIKFNSILVKPNKIKLKMINILI